MADPIRICLSVLCLLALPGFAGQAPIASDTGPAAPKFNRDILPLLSEHCFHCHGPDAGHRKAKLRLDTRDGLFSVRDGTSVVQPGDPGASELIRRITSSDPDEFMPPPESKKALTAGQRELLTRWVEAGAVWQDHWAFIPPVRPDPPNPGDPAWVRNTIDRFILKRLRDAGLEPNPEADRRTLIRRVTLDLTGLPPEPDKVETFVNDPDPNAYEKLVDRLFASERYGERMALAWMDAARYGDSSVFHADGPRYMWPWRDWVINAYNANMPFDRFTIEQLAGDLLPRATIAQKVASGFNRNHGTTDEGGAIDEEYRVEYVVDRVETTSATWLGLTMECGQCHDHKYDPISQKEYYGFYAYFNRTKDRGMQTRDGNAEPIVHLFSPAQEIEVSRLLDRIHEEETLQKERRPGEELIASWAGIQRETPEPAPPDLGAWHKLGPFKARDANEAFNKNFGPEKDPAPDLAKPYGKQKWEEQKDWTDGEVVSLGSQENAAIYLYRTLTVPAPETYRVSLGSDDSIKVWLNGQEILANNAGRGAAPDQETATLNLKSGANAFLMKIGNGGGPTGFYFRLAGSGIPKDIRDILDLADADLSADQRGKLAEYYTKTIWPEGLDRVEDIKSLKEQEKAIRDSVPTSMIMEDMNPPRKTYVLARGYYASPIESEEILPGVPTTLPPLPPDAPGNRLGLARWLVDANHPLTSRVTVNRYWQMLFGEGIVATSSDFGTRGEWPSHPELLDWLARDFVDHGWDVKRSLKQMVMSATYRQGSRVTPEKLEKDPRNRLLSRAPRLRLQGEFVRDNALALSGLLNGRVGGPSTKPYQPTNIWNEVSLDGNLRYQRDRGEALYRRSMYIYWKRSAPLPSMMAFDAPTREKCTIQRQRTNTPLQALVTMNDVQFVEAARMFAERVIRDGGGAFEDRVDFAFRLATCRPADDLRLQSLRRLYDSQLTAFASDPKRAEALIAFGDYPRDTALDAVELAAWTTVTSAILNLDEVLTKE